MKRDMELVRTMILAAEGATPSTPLTSIDGVRENVFAAHAQWLIEAGIAFGGVKVLEQDKEAIIGKLWRLTWSGTELADLIRDGDLWHKAHGSEPVGSLPLSVLTSRLENMLNKPSTMQDLHHFKGASK